MGKPHTLAKRNSNLFKKWNCKLKSQLTWLSKRPANRTRSTSKTQDFKRVTWSSWCKHLNPGINLAKVHTCLTWSMNLSLNCSRKESSGRPFMGQVCKKNEKSIISKNGIFDFTVQPQIHRRHQISIRRRGLYCRGVKKGSTAISQKWHKDHISHLRPLSALKIEGRKAIFIKSFL